MFVRSHGQTFHATGLTVEVPNSSLAFSSLTEACRDAYFRGPVATVCTGEPDGCLMKAIDSLGGLVKVFPGNHLGMSRLYYREL